MPYLNGVVTAGIAEATRVAHTVIHRGAETGIVVVAGQRADQAHADHIPEAEAGNQISRRSRRERDPRDRRRRREGGHEPDDEPGMGSLVDLQA